MEFAFVKKKIYSLNGLSMEIIQKDYRWDLI